MRDPALERATALFRESLDRCIVVPGFLERFYARFLGSSPDVSRRFAHVDMARQASVLRASLYMVLRAAEGSADGRAHLESIAESHSQRGHDITSDLYALWLTSLLETAREVDPLFDGQTEHAWRTCVEPCIARMIARRHALERTR